MAIQCKLCWNIKNNLNAGLDIINKCLLAARQPQLSTHLFFNGICKIFCVSNTRETRQYWMLSFRKFQKQSAVNAVELKGRKMASEPCQAKFPSHTTCINLFIKSSAIYSNTLTPSRYGSFELSESPDQCYTIVQWSNTHSSSSRPK